MSDSPSVKVESDRYTRIIAETVQKYMTDRDFLMTLRGSSLYENEEFDNALVYSTWHFLFETGISQMKDHVASLKRVVAEKKNEKDPKKQIPPEQLININKLIQQFSKYRQDLPVDSKENIKLIRNYLRSYNTSLGYGIIMYDMHTALLNGRYAEHGGQARKDMKEITKTILQRDYEIEVANRTRDDRGLVDKLLHRKS